MLQLQDVHAYYGDSHILKGVSMEIRKGELATLLGRNGAGKTTTLRSILGIIPPRKGGIIFDGKHISGGKPHQIASLGVGYVPEERAIFPSLSVLENLTLPSKKNRTGFWDLEKIFAHFPILKERSHQRGSQLSGGEQQMLAIARGLMARPKLLLMDEPSLGLSPIVIDELARVIEDINKQGVSVLLVEQNIPLALRVANKGYALQVGRIVLEGDIEEFRSTETVKRAYLGG